MRTVVQTLVTPADPIDPRVDAVELRLDLYPGVDVDGFLGSCGKPVVATDIRGCREEVVHGQTGLLVPVGDVPSLARAITQIVSQPQMAQAMGARGRERAEAVYDEQLVLDREMTAYRELMGERAPAVPTAV